MKILVLACALCVGLIGAVPARPDAVYDTIVIGLGSAGTTAATELAQAGRKVLALEAQSRIGGRVWTVPFGDGVVEVGAEWIHGNVSSRTYALATKHDIDTKLQPSVLDPYRSDGTRADAELVNSLVQHDFLEDPPNPPEAVGTFVTKKFKDYIAKNKPELLSDQDFITEFLELSNLLTNSLEASNDWNEVTTADVHSTLFSPPLSAEKKTAIDKISMGVVGKVILSFDKAWWPENISLFAFIWKGEDKKKVPAADYWTTRILGAHPPMGSSNTLTLWTSGEVAKQVEALPEDLVKSKCVALLQRFMGDALNITVPTPTGFLRSTWFSNPFTRGTYSFDNLEAPLYTKARNWLSYPILDSSGEPRVLFAGEATNECHFSTVHGASETGHREAERLLSKISGDANFSVKDC